MEACNAASRVLFVSMPFAPLLTPSLGLSLLKAQLARSGIASEILYFGINYARQITPRLYAQIAGGAPATHDLAGEWIFSGAVFQQEESAIDLYTREVLHGNHPAHCKKAMNQTEFPAEFFSGLLETRATTGDFLDECVDEVVARRPRLVGFTSVFQQNLASLALARRIRERLPDAFLLFGGANCEGVMGLELLRNFPFLDAVVSGPGESVIVPLAESVLNDGRVGDLPGVLTAQHLSVDGIAQNAPQPARMDDLPLPDFDDYFNQLKISAIELPIPPRLLFETSRGCWWGQKHHCTFCGLNGQSMQHRSKSADRALSELEAMDRRYPGLPISVVDNILDMQYFKDFLPTLAQRNRSLPEHPGSSMLELFYEVKANLSKAQLHMLRSAGVTEIQPGIESFSDDVLRLMKKGVRGWQNIQLLKWCKELGILPSWNILWGFPGESPEDYQEMAQLVPLLAHYPPPGSAAPIRLDRFSPNFESPIEHGFQNVRPYPAYYYVYSLPDHAIRNLAYFFIYDRADRADAATYTGPLARQLREWQEDYEETDFFSVNVGPWLFLWDFRRVARRPLTALTGLDRILYRECDQAHTIAQLSSQTDLEGQAASAIEQALDAMCAEGLMLRSGDYYLSLAIRGESYTPNAKVLRRLKSALRDLGRRDGEVDVTTINCQDYALTTV